MDTSETYIKMCDCPEIQDKTKDDRCCFWAEKLITGKYFVMCGFKKDIWLPRQDQIQGMLGLKDTSLLIHRFHKFCYRDSITNLMEGGSNLVFKFPISISMEQLWLAFYMHEKHKKTWDGKQWKL